MYRIFCQHCTKEISWYTIPFFSVNFCNPQCQEDDFIKREAKRNLELDRILEKKQEAFAESNRCSSNYVKGTRELEDRYRLNHPSIEEQRQKYREDIARRHAQSMAETKKELKEVEKARKKRREEAERLAKEYQDSRNRVCCRVCKLKYQAYTAEHNSPVYCSNTCRDFFLEKKKQEEYEERKRARDYQRHLKLEKLENQSTCSICQSRFSKEYRNQKWCGEICRLKIPIKRSNDNWLKNTHEKQLENAKKRAKETRRKGELLNKAHVKKPEWTGKQYKAVRG